MPYNTDIKNNITIICAKSYKYGVENRMKALVYEGKRDLRLEELRFPSAGQRMFGLRSPIVVYVVPMCTAIWAQRGERFPR